MNARSTARWRTRLTRTAVRTTATAVGVLTVAGAALVGGTGAASAAPTAHETERRICAVTQLLRNGGFENPTVTDNGGAWQLFPNNTPGVAWRSLDGNVELWRGIAAPHRGAQHAEINASASRNVIWQAFRTVPRTTLRWSVAVKARNVSAGPDRDTFAVRINGRLVDVERVGENGWTVLRGTYRVPRGAWISRIGIQALDRADQAGYGGLVDTASVRGVRCF